MKDVKGLVALLQDGGLQPQVFSGISGNPVKSQVDSGVSAFKEHAADVIVGMGGGAALDVAKSVALMIHHPGSLFEYEDEKPSWTAKMSSRSRS